MVDVVDLGLANLAVVERLATAAVRHTTEELVHVLEGHTLGLREEEDDPDLEKRVSDGS